jgi:hypothetical protein
MITAARVCARASVLITAGGGVGDAVAARQTGGPRDVRNRARQARGARAIRTVPIDYRQEDFVARIKG